MQAFYHCLTIKMQMQKKRRNLHVHFSDNFTSQRPPFNPGLKELATV